MGYYPESGFSLWKKKTAWAANILDGKGLKSGDS